MANLRWLRLGLGIKRWILLICSSLLLVICGSIAFGLGLFGVLEESQNLLISPYTIGILLLLCGGAGVFVGVYRLSRHIEKLLKHHGETRNLTEIAIARAQTGAKIVCIGGGTGMNRLLSGLREYSSRITAVVSVADDGGSSGRLRNEFGLLPPGDIRNCLSALANAGATMTGLLQYRFAEGELAGHSFGNLFIMVLTKICGTFDLAVREANHLLNVRGQVLPVSLEQVTLVATHDDGTKTTGQKNISECGRRITKLALKPQPGNAPHDVIERILNAEIIVIGPGSLYTSILPNLLMPDVVKAIADSKAKVFFIVNTTAQPGETAGFKVRDYLDTLYQHAPELRLDAAIVNNCLPAPTQLEKLKTEEKDCTDFHDLPRGRVRILLREVINLDDPEKHHAQKLAQAIIDEWENG